MQTESVSRGERSQRSVVSRGGPRKEVVRSVIRRLSKQTGRRNAQYNKAFIECKGNETPQKVEIMRSSDMIPESGGRLSLSPHRQESGFAGGQGACGKGFAATTSGNN